MGSRNQSKVSKVTKTSILTCCAISRASTRRQQLFLTGHRRCSSSTHGALLCQLSPAAWTQVPLPGPFHLIWQVPKHIHLCSSPGSHPPVPTQPFLHLDQSEHEECCCKNRPHHHHQDSKQQDLHNLPATLSRDLVPTVPLREQGAPSTLPGSRSKPAALLS